MIRYTIPFSTEKNLARAYNLEMELAPYGSYVCFTDRDIWFPHPNFAHQIDRIVSQHGEAVYTCYTNRVNCSWQRIPFKGNGQDAERFSRELYAKNVSTVEDHTDSQLMSGFMVIFPKDRWVPLPEKEGLLGVDNMIHKMAKTVGLKVLLMKGVFCWHYYGGFEGEGGNQKRDKSHLQ